MIKTVGIFFWTLILSLPLGLLIAFGRMSKNKIVSTVFKFYISVMRGTPLMLQLLVVYFGPYYLFGAKLSQGYRFIAIIIGFVLNYAAYYAEIYRSGIESMPVGQYEAGKVLGMTRSQVFFKVILLQVIKRIVPPMSNEVIILTKDTSLARVIGLAEIIMSAERFTKQGLIWPLFSTGLYFLVFNGLLSLLFGWIEKKMDYFRV